MSTPVVSVVIPTHNRPTEVRRAVASVLAQTMSDLEVIVVDDGSVPPVALGSKDPRVTVVRHERARGVSEARNTAIDAATGTWVAFLDDDDFWAPDKLERQLTAARASGAGLVYSAAWQISPLGTVVGHLGAPPAAGLTRGLLGTNVIGGPSTVVVRRDDVLAAGPFATDLSVLADWDMWLRLSERCRAAPVQHTTTALLVHPGNMQVTKVAQVKAEVALMEQRHAHLLPGARDRIGSAWWDAWVASRQWRAEPSARNALIYGYRYARRPERARTLLAGARRLRGPVTTPEWVTSLLSQ